MTIEQVSTAQLPAIVAGLVEAGLTFRAIPMSDTHWRIELLGGY